MVTINNKSNIFIDFSYYKIIEYVIFCYLYILGLTEGVTCENSIDLSPSNPFLESQYKHEECDMALQTLQVIII